MSIEAIKEALAAYSNAVDAVIATQEGDDPHAAALAVQGVERAQEVWKTWTQPEYIAPLIERLEAAEKKDQSGIQVGDYFTHKRTGARFVCRSVTRHDHDGAFQSLRVELDPDPESGGLAEGVSDA